MWIGCCKDVTRQVREFGGEPTFIDFDEDSEGGVVIGEDAGLSGSVLDSPHDGLDGVGSSESFPMVLGGRRRR